MNEISERIAAWEASGIIDRATADRLREAELATVGTPGLDDPSPSPTAPVRSSASAMFGPSVSIAEVFGYLGGAFLLAAWSSFMARAAGGGGAEATLGVMAAIAAAVLAGLGLAIRRNGEPASRAAGVAFVLVSSYVGAAALAFATAAGLDWPIAGVVASGAALGVALVLRMVHPAVLTQVGVLSWATALSASLLAWLQVAIFPEDWSSSTGEVTMSGPDPILLVVASAAWWLVTAVILALVGLREARAAERDRDPAGARRAAVSRFWAGLTAVIGLAMAVSRSAPTVDGEYGRVLEPVVGDLALIILSAVLIERAFRRDATAFIYAAALGLMVALTDFNVSYLSDSTETALLVEGLILLGVGVAADRLRRRIGRTEDPIAPGAPDEEPRPPLAEA